MAGRSSPTTRSLPKTLRSIRVHGQGSDKYDNVRLGLTGRLDTMQAAILIEKLKIFEDEIAARNKVAERYAQGLGNVVTFRPCRAAAPRSGRNTPSGCRRHRSRRIRRGAEGAGHSDRDLLSEIDAPADRLSGFPVADGGLPVSEKLSGDVISLPMHAYLDEPTQERIIKAVRGALSS